MVTHQLSRCYRVCCNCVYAWAVFQIKPCRHTLGFKRGFSVVASRTLVTVLRFELFSLPIRTKASQLILSKSRAVCLLFRSKTQTELSVVHSTLSVLNESTVTALHSSLRVALLVQQAWQRVYPGAYCTESIDFVYLKRATPGYDELDSVSGERAEETACAFETH